MILTKKNDFESKKISSSCEDFNITGSISYNSISNLGLVVYTGIDLPNEALGYQGKSTLSGLLLDFSIGQYDTYTNMQLNQYISTIAQNAER